MVRKEKQNIWSLLRDSKGRQMNTAHEDAIRYEQHERAHNMR